MDKLINKAPNDLTDYRIVKLSDGSTLVGSISLDKEFLRIQNPLQLITTPRMTDHGIKDDNTLAPWVPFTNDKMFVIPKEKVMVISRAAKELANYYDVILTKLQQTKVKAVYSAEEINKIMDIADRLEKQLRDGEEDDVGGKGVHDGGVIDVCNGGLPKAGRTPCKVYGRPLRGQGNGHHAPVLVGARGVFGLALDLWKEQVSRPEHQRPGLVP